MTLEEYRKKLYKENPGFEEAYKDFEIEEYKATRDYLQGLIDKESKSIFRNSYKSYRRSEYLLYSKIAIEKVIETLKAKRASDKNKKNI